MRAAIYARQSADKRDSISIESQIEDCRSIAGEDPFIFSDKGYTGANLLRPAFCELMELVECGKIDKIIIYRLDRISRSLPDFVNLTEKLKRHGVTLCSKSEGFDTSSETSLILLNILMMFAQMERGAISQRVRDNYYSRGKKGLYLGGYAPFGYDKKPLVLGNIRTSYFVKNADSAIVHKIYEQYSNGASYTSLAAQLNDFRIPTSRGNRWTAGSIKRIIRNPVYVMANAEVYRFLLLSGAKVCSDPEIFDGRHGCICFGSPKERVGAKFSTLDGENVVIGAHEGIIEPSLWLSAQRKNTVGDYSKGQTSFLQGMMKCVCGYSLYLKSYKDRKYLCCRGRKLHICNISHAITCDELEQLIEPLICKRIEFLSRFEPATGDIDSAFELSELDRRFSRLIHMLSESTDDEAIIISRELSDIKKRRTQLCSAAISANQKRAIDFPSLTLLQKKSVCRQLIDRIEISETCIRIVWQ